MSDTPSIYEQTQGNLEEGLREATRCMNRVGGIDRQLDNITSAWEAEIADLQRQIETIRAYADTATEELRHTRSWYMRRLDQFRDDFAAMLPKRLTGFETPVGRFRRDKCRTTSVHEADGAVLPLLSLLPSPAQDEAIQYKASVSWSWVRAHYTTDDEGQPVIRYTDTDTGEVTEVVAVVKREVAGGEEASIPIIRDIPPAHPYTTSIEWHKDASMAAGAEGVADEEEQEDVTNGD